MNSGVPPLVAMTCGRRGDGGVMRIRNNKEGGLCVKVGRANGRTNLDILHHDVTVSGKFELPVWVLAAENLLPFFLRALHDGEWNARGRDRWHHKSHAKSPCPEVHVKAGLLVWLHRASAGRSAGVNCDQLE